MVKKMKNTLLQIALDIVDLNRALELAKIAVENGADIIEAGTPLLQAYGICNVLPRLYEVVRDQALLLADLKIPDTGELSSRLAFEHHANIVSVLGCASTKTIADAIKMARRYNGQVIVDLICSTNVREDVKKALELGADYILIHTGLDQQASGVDVLSRVKALANLIPAGKLAVAGGIKVDNIENVLRYSPAIVIVGGAFYKASNPGEVVRKIKDIIHSYTPI